MKKIVLMLWISVSLLFNGMAANRDIQSTWNVYSKTPYYPEWSVYLNESIYPEEIDYSKRIFEMRTASIEKSSGETMVNYSFANLDPKEEYRIQNYISLTKYNCEKLKAPLELKKEMTKDNVAAALFSAFGDNIIIERCVGMYYDDEDLDFYKHYKEAFIKEGDVIRTLNGYQVF